MMKFTNKTAPNEVKRSAVEPGQAFNYMGRSYLALDNCNKAFKPDTSDYWAVDETACCTYMSGNESVKIINLTIEA